MNEYVDRVGPERLWAAVVVTLGAAAILAALAFPQRVYVEVVWQYFWGPVVADAHSWSCVAWADGAQVECAEADNIREAGPYAEPGYTFVSYAGYIPTLILLLLGVVFLVRRLEITRYRAGFYGLFPFMLFGGVLRVVEDANATAYSQTGEMAISMPYSGLLISPLIYGTVFLVALVAVVASVWLDRNGYVDGYEYPLAGIGTAILLVTLGYLSYLAATEPYVTVYWGVPAVILVGATVATAATWGALEAFVPEANRGTGYMGLVVVWAHAVDGVANVVGLDWATELGLPYNLSPKHPINAAIVDYTDALLPQGIVEVTGAAWPFLLVKLVVAAAVVSLFDDQFLEESPRFAVLLLITVVAVGLGPGTRDMVRATFGV